MSLSDNRYTSPVLNSRSVGTFTANLGNGTVGTIGHQDALRQIALDAFLFWTLQVTEHMLILFLGLEDDQLKQLAYSIHLEWIRFVPQPSMERQVLPRYQDIDWNRLFALIDQTRAFQVQVKDLVESCVWQGWLSGAYIHHITEELDYFSAKVHLQTKTIDQEFLFWLDIFKDHAATVASFIDQRERTDIAKANGVADGMIGFINQYKDQDKKVGDADADGEMLAMRQAGMQHADELEQWYHNFLIRYDRCQIKSTLHPVLAAHIEREHQYGLALLSLLLNNTNQL